MPKRVLPVPERSACRRPLRSAVPPSILALLLMASALATSAENGSAQNPAATAKVEIHGRVTDADTGAPLHGAFVSLKAHEWGVLADDQGRFVLRVDRAATYVVVSENLGYAKFELELAEPEPDNIEIHLEASAIQLDGIKVMADRFQSRRRAASTSVRSFERNDLLSSASRDLAEYLKTRVGRPIQECPFRSGFASMCTFRRGRMTAVQVYIDEMPTLGGLAELESYRPQELFLLEVYGGGSQIRVYTTRFMDRIIRSGKLLNPLPIW